ncbi:MAG: RNA-binding protein [Thaumarchaeota archaeon]|nr:RNA-binding protein [Nitrososphaerota archaeon]
MGSLIDVETLGRIEGRLREIEERREKILRDVRAVTLNASKAIISVHAKRRKEAERLLKESRRVLVETSKIAGNDLQKYLIQPAAEFVEASITIAVSKKKKSIPKQEELGVDDIPYLLGILDAVGEIKRMVYDRLREGRVKEAIRLFKAMEDIYASLTPFAAYDHIVQGIRRKTDVARVLIEDTRAIVTEELRRAALIKDLQKTIKMAGSDEP